MTTEKEPATTAGAGPPARRGPRRRPWLLLSPLVAVAVIVGGFTAAEGMFTRTYVTTTTVMQPVRTLDLSVLQGDVRVVGAPTDSITITRTVTTSLRDPIEKITTVGDRLHLVSSCEAALKLCRTDFEIRVPRSTSLYGKVVFGDGELRGLDGTVHLKARRGGITAHDLHGSTMLETGTGNVVARGLNAASVSVTSAGGDVFLADGRFKRVVAHSDSGNVTVRGPERFASIRATSVTGDVIVLVPDTTRAYSVSASPGAKTTLEVPVDERGPAIQAESGSGAVIVRPS